jgi:hypothetical protein
MIRTAILLTASLMLSACAQPATTGTSDPAPRGPEGFTQDTTTFCKSIPTDPRLTPIREDVILKGPDTGTRVFNQKFISDPQKPILMLYQSLLDQCIDKMSRDLPGHDAEAERIKRGFDANIANLYDGKITFGQYNRTYLKVMGTPIPD